MDHHEQSPSHSIASDDGRSPQQAPPRHNDGDDLLSVLAALEQQVARLREARAAEAEAAEGVQQRLQSLEQRESDLLAHGRQLDAQRAECLRMEDALAQQRQALDAMREELNGREQALEQRAAQNTGFNEAAHRELHEAGAEIMSLASRLVAAKQESFDHAADLYLLREGSTSSESEHQPAGSPERRAELEHAVTERDQRISELKAETEGLRQAAAWAAESGQATSEAALAELREKESRIKEIASHLRRRQGRLRAVRQAVARRKAQIRQAAHEAKAAAMREVENRKQQLSETRIGLAETEQRMVRAWARPRSIVTTGWLVLLLLFNAGAGWLLAEFLHPTQRTASVSIEPRLRSGSAPEPAVLTRWTDWHEGLLAERAFIDTLANRYRERRLDRYADAAVLQEYLAEHLSTDRHEGRLTLTLAGSPGSEVAALLDLLTATLLTESGRRLEQRGDGLVAISSNQRTERGRVTYATLNPWPTMETRWPLLVGCFAATLALSVMLVWLVYRRLVRVRRIFEEEGTLA